MINKDLSDTVINNNLSDTVINKDYCVYLLVHNIHNRTYLGITNNKKRRIRQHNCIIKGGAKYTSSNLLKKEGGQWKYYLIIPNLTKREALSKERIIKNKRRKGKGKTPLLRRIDIINKMGLKYIIM